MQEHLLLYAENGLEVPESKWETPPQVVENEKTTVGLPDPDQQTGDVIQPDIVDKQNKKAVRIDVT